MMIRSISTLFVLLFAAACSPKIDSAASQPVISDAGEAYQVWQGDALVDREPDEKPVSRLGRDGFFIAMYKDIRYPAEARERNIQGVVSISVVIDEAGQVREMELIEGLGYGCDEEALKAVQRGCAAGFTPARLNGEPVRVKYIVPVKFRLQ